MVKNLPAKRETWVWSLDWEDCLEEGMESHSSILAWRIPWTEEPRRLQSRGCKELDTPERLSILSLSLSLSIYIYIYVYIYIYIYTHTHNLYSVDLIGKTSLHYATFPDGNCLAGNFRLLNLNAENLILNSSFKYVTDALGADWCKAKWNSVTGNHKENSHLSWVIFCIM